MQRYPNADQYLAQSVLQASPARLRLLLIERALPLAISLAKTPTGESGSITFAERTLHLREILGELLNGVSSGESDVCRSVADLYVFLLQFMTSAEAEHDAAKWNRIAEILEIERETWAAVCAQQATASTPSDTSGLTVQQHPGQPVGAGHTLPAVASAPPLTSLNLEV